MDFTSNYMGLTLRTPIIVSSSGLTKSVSRIKRMADSGAGAVVLKSLFEEQLINDPKRLMDQEEMYYWYPEAIEYLNNFTKEEGVDAYLKLIRDAKEAVNIPVIASINCVTPKEWPSFAVKIKEAGADGLELNIAINPFDASTDSKTIEDRYVEILNEVKKNVDFPVAVKLGYNFTNLAQIAHRLDKAGVDALVFFNRFYRPDIDINNLQLISGNIHSSPQEITESLRWIRVLSPVLKCDLAGATGIHNAGGIIKQLLVGADTVQVASTLYKHGIEYIEKIIEDLVTWMKKFNYTSVQEFKDLMVQKENTAAFERVQFMKKTIGEVE